MVFGTCYSVTSLVGRPFVFDRTKGVIAICPNTAILLCSVAFEFQLFLLQLGKHGISPSPVDMF